MSRTVAMDASYGEYRLTDDRRRVDLDAVCRLLSQTYWAATRPRDRIERTVRNSLCFSIHYRDGQVGFARVLTDEGASSYLCDVVIDPAHRNRGVGGWLLRCILAHPSVADTRMLLITRDAQAFYGDLGFATHPYECMVRAPSGSAPENHG